jgi:dolichol-phosphate mannosyltransferase
MLACRKNQQVPYGQKDTNWLTHSRQNISGDRSVKSEITRPERPLISIVVPVYNEESNIRAFHESLTGALRECAADIEIIFVDDGSTDTTFLLIEDLAQSDTRIKAVRLSKNFGSHAALLAGLRMATGDAAVMISADLQDPPAMIPAFVQKWREGFHIVWALREGRDDPFFKKIFANAFYSLFTRIALKDYPAAGMDFGLFDRSVLDHLKNFKENNFDIVLVIMSLGFRQCQIPFYRNARHSGNSKWSLTKSIKSAVDLIVSYSYFPIRFISYLGIVISMVSFIYALFLIASNLVFGIGPIGWPSIMVAVLFLGGVQLIMLGILGEYIWRCNDQVKMRPQYIVMETIGFEKPLNQPHAQSRSYQTSG